MKANELRIGNWIHNPVQGVDFKDCVIALSEINFEDGNKIKDDKYRFQPIPLTPEWLERFGFDGYEESGYFEKRGFFFYVGTCKDGSYYLEHPDSGHLVGQPIKHVHQLQNLYFALTGEELTLNN